LLVEVELSLFFSSCVKLPPTLCHNYLHVIVTNGRRVPCALLIIRVDDIQFLLLSNRLPVYSTVLLTWFIKFFQRSRYDI